MASEMLFEARHMHKEYGSTIALKDVDFTLNRGEIRGLIGENGSGKSTIMSIAAGMQSATGGEMTYLGKPWRPSSMVDSQRAGISMILQEANTIPGVTVAQNLYAGREKEFSKLGVINMRRMYRAADAMLKCFGVDSIRGRDSIDSLTFEDRKLMEIVRCVDDNTQILVVDETTTALSLEGRQLLYRLMHRMAEENKTVVFISHDMDEILTQCTALTVLRDGEIIGTLDRRDMDAPDAVKQIRYMMVGRDIGERYYREDYDFSCKDEIALEMRDVCFGAIRDFNLTLHRGEIVGMGGLSGCGMHELGRAAYGLQKLESGKVLRNGMRITGCLQAIRQGIGYISKNRDTESLILDAAIQNNIVLPSLSALQKYGFIDPRREKMISDKQIKAFRIKCNSGRQYTGTLSGGNKQKVSFAKWMAKDSDVIIMDCPTRGVDVGVKQAMYALIDQMKHDGKAIFMISEELSELIGMADRILIMRDFLVTREFSRSAELKQTDIIEYMI